MSETQILKIKSLIERTSNAEEDYLNALQVLAGYGLPSLEILKRTRIGKSLNTLAAKAIHENVRVSAKRIEQAWRRAYRAGTIGSSPVEQIHETDNTLPKRGAPSDVVSKNQSKKPCLVFDSADHPKQFSRDRVRKLLYDAANACHQSVKEMTVKSEDSVAQHFRKPDLLSAEIEGALHDHMQTEKDYRAQARSIAFNLRDDSNTAFRLKVLLGHIPAHQFPVLTPEEMANDATRLLRAQARDDAMKAVDIEAFSKRSEDGTKGLFTCDACQSEDTINFQIPSGKPDAAPTIVVICTACSHRSNIQDKEC